MVRERITAQRWSELPVLELRAVAARTTARVHRPALIGLRAGEAGGRLRLREPRGRAAEQRKH